MKKIVHEESGQVIVERAHWCNSFTSKLRGFTFRRELEPGEGLVLVERGDGRINSGVTMLFTFIPLGVIWVNSSMKIVDKTVAKPWRWSYRPKAPAQYAIECDPSNLEHVNVGDRLQFIDLREAK